MIKKRGLSQLVNKPRGAIFGAISPKLRASLAKNMNLTSITSTQNDIMHVLFSGRNLIVKSNGALRNTMPVAYLCSPRSIIFGPSAQFVFDTEKLLRQMSPSTRVVCLTNNSNPQTQLEQLYQQPVDVILAEPRRLVEFVEKHLVLRNALQLVVCDGMDEMYQKDFYELAYFYAKIELKVKRAITLGTDKIRDVQLRELTLPKNNFQNVVLTERLLLTQIQRDFSRYLEKPTTLLNFAEIKTVNPSTKKKQLSKSIT
ncbi:hypothetical protein BASA81_001160 [Batrachochytrium salamandrivorans]|nr:hypothetical protein BASA81_001160 [Batrachochytrium salamandrivorans]